LSPDYAGHPLWPKRYWRAGLARASSIILDKYSRKGEWPPAFLSRREPWV
jgi:hypothetical protein